MWDEMWRGESRCREVWRGEARRGAARRGGVSASSHISPKPNRVSGTRACAATRRLSHSICVALVAYLRTMGGCAGEARQVRRGEATARRDHISSAGGSVLEGRRCDLGAGGGSVRVRLRRPDRSAREHSQRAAAVAAHPGVGVGASLTGDWRRRRTARGEGAAPEGLIGRKDGRRHPQQSDARRGESARGLRLHIAVAAEQYLRHARGRRSRSHRCCGEGHVSCLGMGRAWARHGHVLARWPRTSAPPPPRRTFT